MNIISEPEWEFMKKLEDVEAVEREKATFTCDVSDPEAEVSWFKDEKVGVTSLFLAYKGHFYTIFKNLVEGAR